MNKRKQKIAFVIIQEMISYKKFFMFVLKGKFCKNKSAEKI